MEATHAERIKATHSVEYVLYLWQVEDLVRATDFDPVFVRDVEARMVDRWRFPVFTHDLLDGARCASKDDMCNTRSKTNGVCNARGKVC